MQKQQVLDRITGEGLLPVLRAESTAQALAIAQALEAGGVTILEVTMTVPNAVQLIEQLADTAGDRLLIGAGTVLDAETARASMLAGAQFIVSPALDRATIEICRRYSVAVFPGALTPTEVLAAWQAGADAVKVFPASALGGAKYLRALKAPFPQIELIPTGGVTLETAHEFLRAGAFALGVGGDLVDPAAIRNGHPETITASARKYLEIIAAHRTS